MKKATGMTNRIGGNVTNDGGNDSVGKCASFGNCLNIMEHMSAWEMFSKGAINAIFYVNRRD